MQVDDKVVVCEFLVILDVTKLLLLAVSGIVEWMGLYKLQLFFVFDSSFLNTFTTVTRHTSLFILLNHFFLPW